MLMLQRAASRAAAAATAASVSASASASGVLGSRSSAVACRATPSLRTAALLFSRHQQSLRRLQSSANAALAPEPEILDAQSAPPSSAAAGKTPRSQESDSELAAANGEEAGDVDTELFASLKGRVSPRTLSALIGRPFNFTKMSSVQQRVLNLMPELIEPGSGEFQDLLVKAKTGTGKTIAFLVPAVEARFKAIQAIRDGTFPHFQPWEDMLKRNRPELFQGQDKDSKDVPEDARLDYSALSDAERRKLSTQFSRNTVGALIISPTRELATQIATEARKLITNHQNALQQENTRQPRAIPRLQPNRNRHMQQRVPSIECVHTLVGGMSRINQLQTWRQGRPDVVVGTPGRVLDMLKDDTVHAALSACQTLILDEADTLLDMGFRDEIRSIVEQLPNAQVIVRKSGKNADAPVSLSRQTFLFSATASPKIREVASWALSEKHTYIDCVPKGESNTHEHIPQSVYVIKDPKKHLEFVARLIAHDQLVHPGQSKIVVFTPTTIATKMISRMLSSLARSGGLPANTFDRKGQQGMGEEGIGGSVYEIHSKLDQSQRFRVSTRFRNDKSGGAVLVTSDVSARGVDYPGVTRVIQWGVPGGRETYIHRIGRTGRAGALGGRADIVLQPFEAGFLNGALHKLPIRVAESDELEKELVELASGFDESGYAGLRLDPERVSQLEANLKQAGSQRRGGRFGARGPPLCAPFRAPLLPIVQPAASAEGDANTADSESISRSPGQIRIPDTEAVRECFLSLAGFYSSVEQADLRASKSEMIDSLSRWTTELTGDPDAGHLSPAMLTRLGVKRVKRAQPVFERRTPGSRSARWADDDGSSGSGGFGGFGDERRSRFGGGGDRGGRPGFGRGGDSGFSRDRGGSSSFSRHGGREGGFSRDRGGFSRDGRWDGESSGFSREGGFSRGGDGSERGPQRFMQRGRVNSTPRL
ncbi:hypothetical protein OC834_001389 [Tilletia horrida]|nr:hypothetical protein OC834_001389 [Tilletia horrida]